MFGFVSIEIWEVSFFCVKQIATRKQSYNKNNARYTILLLKPIDIGKLWCHNTPVLMIMCHIFYIKYISQYITGKIIHVCTGCVHILPYVLMVLLQDTHRNMWRNIKWQRGLCLFEIVGVKDFRLADSRWPPLFPSLMYLDDVYTVGINCYMSLTNTWLTYWTR